AAVEQLPAPDGRFHFLQRRVIDDALRHAETHDWLRRPRRLAHVFLLAHLVAAAAALGVSVLVIRGHRPAAAAGGMSTGVAVTPGLAEVQRGAAFVIAKRLPVSKVPQAFTLVWQSSGAAARRSPMSRSLSVPVVAFAFPTVSSDITSQIAYGG